MQPFGDLRIDPGTLDGAGAGRAMEIAVPYTEWSLARAVMDRVPALTAGLNATVRLIAVHVVPYPLTFRCPASVHAFLVEQLLDLASRSPLSVDPQVVLARYQEEGFRRVLDRQSIVLIGARRRFWRTQEEKLARALAHEGHQVVLLHID